MWGLVAASALGGLGAGLGLWSGISQAKAAAKEADRRRAAEILSAKYQYSATESAANLTKATTRELTNNAINEALRAGSSQQREVSKEVDKAISSQVAAGEGLTSGRSAGRDIVTTLVKGSKAIQGTKQETSNMISQLVSYQDQQANEINNQLIGAYNQMYSVLTTPGQIYKENRAAIVSGAIQGGLAGYALGSSFGSSSGSSSKKGK